MKFVSTNDEGNELTINALDGCNLIVFHIKLKSHECMDILKKLNSDTTKLKMSGKLWTKLTRLMD